MARVFLDEIKDGPNLGIQRSKIKKSSRYNEQARVVFKFVRYR